jgi:hypothetical protein
MHALLGAFLERQPTCAKNEIEMFAKIFALFIVQVAHYFEDRPRLGARFSARCL